MQSLIYETISNVSLPVGDNIQYSPSFSTLDMSSMIAIAPAILLVEHTQEAVTHSSTVNFTNIQDSGVEEHDIQRSTLAVRI